MGAVKRFLTNWWFVSIVAALFALLVLAVGLPIFVGFLRPWWVRLIAAVVVLAVWGLLAFLHVRKGRKGADAIAAELAAPPSAADEESKLLAQRMGEALGQLRTSAAGKKQRDYLYTRPWYIIIGPPGAGKTTALLNSGLRFPFADQAFKGSGGTRNLDFMFADEAVLVDTAGRYTSQDSDREVDSKGWTGFLSLLKKNRPLQPINGVIVAIGIDELVRGDRVSIDNHAAAVRRRLMELRRTLEIAVPVYVLLTKADLLAGFVEYFEDLDVEGRRAVLGHTLKFGTGAKPSAEQLMTAYDEMAREVADRQAKRLSEEPDAARRALILGFPAQLTALRARLLRFLDGAFVAGDDPAGVLRGVYLTSGVQEGAPFDRIISGMAQVYDQPRGSGGAQGGGRAYFLNRLLAEVMFPEAGLVQFDPAARKRQRGMLIGAMAGVGAIAAIVLLLWAISFVRNRSFESELMAKATEAQGLVRQTGIDMQEVRDSDPDLPQALEALRALRNLPRGYAERQAGWAPLSMRWGLFQSGLSEQAEQTYREGVRRILLPRILLQLEKVIAANQSNPLSVYEPLKVYLMLGAQGPMNKGAVRSWVETHWAQTEYPGADNQTMRAELNQHLKALLEDDDLAGVWPGRKAPLDGQLIASARAAVGQMSMAERAYAILRQKVASSGAAPWTSANVLASGDAAAFANGDEVLQQRVPYFFTRGGFEKSYQTGLQTVQLDLRKDLWVMGGDADTTAVKEQMTGVKSGVASLYARDYNAAWDKVIASLQPADYFHNPAALAAVTRSPSPIKLMLLEVRKNTTFEGGFRAFKEQQVEDFVRDNKDLAELNMGSTTFDAAEDITMHFSASNDYVGDGKSSAPIDEFIAALKDAGTAVQTAKMAGGGLGGEAAQAQMNEAMAKVGTAAAGAPPQLQPFVEKLSEGGGAARVGAATGAVTEDYAQNILPACKAAAQDRYPFFTASANDVTLVDATKVFGMGGTLDQFVSQRLMPLLDTTGPVWRWKEGDPVAAALDPAVPDQFAKAAELRDLMTAGLTIRIAPASFAGTIDAAQFKAGDATFRWGKADLAAAAPKPLRWTAQGGTPEASVTLFQGDKAVATLSEEGIWALFRLMEKATRENAGPTAFLATFGDASAGATFKVTLPSEKNPFAKGGMWTFRCPVTL
ncbi:type VI secretion system membrane subunit TssM [Sphingomonas jatrophae]|uniref:Type VI secretion system protein ImpL n=1 Tax=Sphingomonas jatrophae TaxID=1166337 RepID=A0A1I6LK91_9SPHN|nr:type VI secretion system membrane subunit TssM [Sphingomonas jatrophae]SFS03866.1 type VI secretion system protein ImpL [Sphingomonas jatrophae]